MAPVEVSAVFEVPRSTVSPSHLRLLVYGDSLTAGFNLAASGYPDYEPYANELAKTLADMGVNVSIVGCGLSGLTASQLTSDVDAARLQDVAGCVGPGLRKIIHDRGPFDLALIMAGTNDVGFRHPVDAIVRELKKLHLTCHEFGIPTVALSIPVCGQKHPQVPGVRSAVNKALSDWVMTHSCNDIRKDQCCLDVPVSYVDSSKMLPWNSVSRSKGLWHADGIHFAPAGSREFGRNLASAIFQSGTLLARVPIRPRSLSPDVSDNDTSGKNMPPSVSFQQEKGSEGLPVDLMTQITTQMQQLTTAVEGLQSQARRPYSARGDMSKVVRQSSMGNLVISTNMVTKDELKVSRGDDMNTVKGSEMPRSKSPTVFIQSNSTIKIGNRSGTSRSMSPGVKSTVGNRSGTSRSMSPGARNPVNRSGTSRSMSPGACNNVKDWQWWQPIASASRSLSLDPAGHDGGCDTPPPYVRFSTTTRSTSPTDEKDASRITPKRTPRYKDTVAAPLLTSRFSDEEVFGSVPITTTYPISEEVISGSVPISTTYPISGNVSWPISSHPVSSSYTTDLFTSRSLPLTSSSFTTQSGVTVSSSVSQRNMSQSTSGLRQSIPTLLGSSSVYQKASGYQTLNTSKPSVASRSSLGVVCGHPTTTVSCSPSSTSCNGRSQVISRKTIAVGGRGW